ncbi:MAG TPA: hypothetical protein VGD08_07610 [Stellaceae bacterium]
MTPEPKPHVLVVDEQSDLRDLLPAAFRDHGLSCAIVNDVLLAKRLIWTERIDLIVIDPLVLRERCSALLAYSELLCVPVLPLPGSLVYLEQGMTSPLGKPAVRVRRIVERIAGAVRERQVSLVS